MLSNNKKTPSNLPSLRPSVPNTWTAEKTLSMLSICSKKGSKFNSSNSSTNFSPPRTTTSNRSKSRLNQSARSKEGLRELMLRKGRSNNSVQVMCWSLVMVRVVQVSLRRIERAAKLWSFRSSFITHLPIKQNRFIMLLPLLLKAMIWTLVGELQAVTMRPQPLQRIDINSTVCSINSLPRLTSPTSKPKSESNPPIKPIVITPISLDLLQRTQIMQWIPQLSFLEETNKLVFQLICHIIWKEVQG